MVLNYLGRFLTAAATALWTPPAISAKAPIEKLPGAGAIDAADGIIRKS